MECSRCRGLMVRDHVFDLLDTGIHGDVWRCVCCGHILDPVILANRRRHVVQPPGYKEASSLVEFTAA